MPRQDRDHEAVLNALIAAGWTIRSQQLPLRYGSFNAFLDIVASLATNTLGSEMIVIEVKGFRPRLNMSELEKTIGQYLIYKSWLARLQPTWVVYLAISTQNARYFDTEPLQAIVNNYGIGLVIIDMHQERIVAWKP
jgi:hypothetical protein